MTPTASSLVTPSPRTVSLHRAIRVHALQSALRCGLEEVQEGGRQDEADKLGFAGRFGAGTPRVSDGSLLFLEHMLARMKAPQDGGSRLAIVFNASPLFTGAAGSGESEIRRWIIENDWLEAIVALPDQLFYNTGISTYVWVLTNRKSDQNARARCNSSTGGNSTARCGESLGDKRNELGPDDIRKITADLRRVHREANTQRSSSNEHFGYRRITVERPLRAEWLARQRLNHRSLVRAHPGRSRSSERQRSNRSLTAGTERQAVSPAYL